MGYSGGDMAFAYTRAIREVLGEIVAATPLFAHVRLPEVAVSFAQAQRRTKWGTYAKMVPLRFPGGALEGVEDGARWRIDPFTFRGRDVLYILYVYLPRFHDQAFEDKLLTLFHELFHISPDFDGDLRRFAGANPYHGESRAWFDDQLRPHLRRFLDARSSAPVLDFLREPLDALEARHRGISGMQIRQPAMRRVDPHRRTG